MMLIKVLNKFRNKNHSNSMSICSITERSLKTRQFLCNSREGLGGKFRHGKLFIEIIFGLIKMVQNNT